jgi:riboflavin kinase/FMN adenylyltransferase
VCLLEEQGVGAVYALDFDEAFARRGADEFVRLLSDELRVRLVVCGEDFRFGAGREGTVRTLERRLAVIGVAPERSGGERVSSSLIRRLLAEGEVDRAAALLGRPHSVAGAVVKGQGLGREIGYPTANLDPGGTVLPGTGVYSSTADFGEGKRPAVTYVGQRPTFDGTRLVVETHIPGESRELHGRRLTVEFLRRLRGEESFRDAGELSRRIREDIVAAVGGRKA